MGKQFQHAFWVAFKIYCYFFKYNCWCISINHSFVSLFLITTFAFMRKLLSALSQIMLNPNRGKIAAGNASGSNEVVNPLEDQRGTEVHTGRAEDGQN